MLRRTESKLPRNHTADELPAAIVNKLAIAPDALLGFTVFKRSYDARKKANILLIYQLDVELTEAVEQAVLEKFARQSFVKPRSEERRVGKECRSRWSQDH